MPYIQKELLIGCQRSHPSQRFCQITLTRLLSYSLKILKSCHVSSNPWNFVLLLIDITPLGGCSHDCKYRPNCPQLHRIESSMWFREVLNLLPVSGFATSVCKTTRVCNIFRETHLHILAHSGHLHLLRDLILRFLWSRNRVFFERPGGNIVLRLLSRYNQIGSPGNEVCWLQNILRGLLVLASLPRNPYITHW